MKILVLTQQYPDEHNFYKNMFVHDRIIKYKEINKINKFEVFVPSSKNKRYIFEDVNVIEGNEKELIKTLKKKEYDKIIIHFLTYKMVNSLLKYTDNVPKIIWVHGFEALSWKRRTFNSTDPKFIKYILGNIIQLRSVRKYLDSCADTTFVFVSDWMRQVAEEDLKRKIKKYVILPNAIDTDYFEAQKKQDTLRKNILLIRPFNSRKYATDIALASLESLSQQPNFQEYNITIIGEGKYFKKDTKKISQFSNVTLINKFLSKQEIKYYHEKNGIFLCPTRQDAQGVSMCEAMSSGLIPITSDNTAIPEFVIHNKSGILTNSSCEITKAINKISNDVTFFQKLSTGAAKQMFEKCNSNLIINEELTLIMN